MEINMSNQNYRTITGITRFLDNNITVNTNDPDDSDIEFEPFTDKVIRAVYRLWEPHHGDPTYQHLDYLHSRLYDAGYTSAPTADEAYDYYRSNFSPEEDDYENVHRMDRLRRWLQEGQTNSQQDDPEKRSIRNTDREGLNFFQERSLNTRIDNWFRTKFRISHIKRLIFSETMKEVQTGILAYLQISGIKYARWNLSSLHSVNDICDVHANHIWLSFQDVGPAYREIRRDMRGIFRADEVDNNLLFPELEQWDEGQIEDAIRHYGRRRLTDPRPKRAGYLIPHPYCKCYINPIIPERRD